MYTQCFRGSVHAVLHTFVHSDLHRYFHGDLVPAGLVLVQHATGLSGSDRPCPRHGPSQDSAALLENMVLAGFSELDPGRADRANVRRWRA